MAKDCQKYWWTNILYINNYIAVENMVTDIFIIFPCVLQICWLIRKENL